MKEFVEMGFIFVLLAAKRVIISISEADWLWWMEYTTPVAALPLCGANYESASPRLCFLFNTDFYKIILARIGTIRWRYENILWKSVFF